MDLSIIYAIGAAIIGIIIGFVIAKSLEKGKDFLLGKQILLQKIRTVVWL